MDIKSLGVRKGAWTPEEDHLLKTCVDKYGEGKWHQIPLQGGLNRCRKSCRLRWLNYLKPNIKRGNFSVDEIDLMIRLHKLLGNRWSLIAGRLPGRTSNDVKNYWNTHLKKSIASQKTNPQMSKEHKICRPQPRAFSINLQWLQSKTTTTTADNIQTKDNFINSSPVSALCGDGTSWWDDVAIDVEINVGNNCWFEDGSTAEPPIVGVWDERKGPGEGESGWGDIVIDDVELWDLNNF